MKRSPLKRRTPLKRTGFRKATGPRRPRNPERSRKYLRWIRMQPCCVHGCSRASQAAHTGEHAYARKSSDYSAVPLCAEHHLWEYRDSYHRLGPRAFEKLHGINLEAVVNNLLRIYRGQQ